MTEPRRAAPSSDGSQGGAPMPRHGAAPEQQGASQPNIASDGWPVDPPSASAWESAPRHSSQSDQSVSEQPQFDPSIFTQAAQEQPVDSSSSTSSTQDTPGTKPTESRRNHPFTRALLATFASTLLPGSGLIKGKSRHGRVIGWSVLSLALLSAATIMAIYFIDLNALVSIAVRPNQLYFLAGGLILFALVWVSVIVGTHLVRRPAKLTRSQRTTSSVTVGLLSLLVSAPLAVASQYALSQAWLIKGVFTDDTRSQTRTDLEGTSVQDIWNKKPRLNILLLGGDSTESRLKANKDRGLLTDTIMIASIDTKTGKISLIQIPRNMERTPFPAGSELQKKYPQGWYAGRNRKPDEFLVNTIWNNVARDHADLVGPSDYPGADALKMAVGEAVGLKLDYFVMLNIDGLQQLIDAMGGVTVNINQRLPIAGSSDNPRGTTGWLEPGPNQHLDGYRAMWYARSRWNTDDFNRMSRQSCLVNAIIKQSDPSTVLTRYEAIAQASKNMIETDIPQSALPAMMELAMRVKTGGMQRLMFQNGKDGFVSSNPDFDHMRQQVKELLDPSAAPATTQPPKTTEPAPTPKGTTKPAPSTKPTAPATTAEPTAAPQEESQVSDACAYNPVKPER